MSGRGKPLEIAIARGGVQYRREGRAVLFRQEPPIHRGKDGLAVHGGTAPVDFLGGEAGGIGLAIECKSSENKHSFGLVHLREDQRLNLAALHKLGMKVMLVVAFDAHGETFGIEWQHVAGFLAKPWRESLTIAWCRAYGLLLPEIDRDNPKTRRCLFLDGKEHPQARTALELVALEKRRSPSAEHEELELDLPEPTKPSRYEGLTLEQRKERILQAAQDGMERQMKSAARRMVFRGGKR